MATSSKPRSSSGARRASGDGGSSRSRSTASKPRSAAEVAEAATRQLRQLSGKETEAITGLERAEAGWTVEVEVVELRRVPATTDVIACYQVDMDADGSLQGYRRVRRYSRGDARDER